MRKFLQNIVTEVVYYLELILSAILAIALLILSLLLLVDLVSAIPDGIQGTNFLQEFLTRTITLAVGVEFIKMLCKQSPRTVIEVLLVAIARQLIVEHASSVDYLIGMVSVAILFAVRKYLFIQFDDSDNIVMRASQKVKVANIIARVKIPGEKGETLRDFVVRKLNEEEKTISIGACVYLKNVALRVDNMHGDLVTRIEIIKSIY
ncbi:hypothetical protein [Streptococcus acidominimus]|uniref:Membrane protein n=1 Tax=Streptococcus acidominimus TaxID=1326 RepID=A0A1Q8EC94_STRAI|nr:hypothetical protein [Streptococcus acidominimus]MBF0847643.1 hypothetical protein [Streptococcus danieliae]MBF0819043.1 hypothetical protein [Streptococcus acidominimus]MBF0837948.1 hypothetical protein [Streptococcus acidominimus]OLF49415.1 hypothetical protein BU200_07415 [Streptococcus acidominimus]TFU30454.1 hypothetical protein E4U01_06280 [Streptococcus acidominimus]